VELFFKAVVLQLLRYLLLREGLAEIGSVLPATANLTRLLLLSFFLKKITYTIQAEIKPVSKIQAVLYVV
jgi:hypothetical protein